MRKLFKSIILILILALIFYLSWFYYQTKNLKLGSVEKQIAVKNLLGHDPINPSPVAQGSQTYSNNYFSISFPKAASIYHYDPTYKSGPVDLSYFAFQEKNPELFFVATVTSHPNMELSDIPGVMVRQKDKNYSSQKLEIDGQNGLVFENNTPDDSGNLEKTAYFTKDSKVYSFSMTGSDISEINNLFNNVLESVKFN